MEDRKAWLQGRKTYIGGSEIAALHVTRESRELNPFLTPLSIYLNKTSDEIVEDTNDAMEWGNRLESSVAEAYSDKTGNKLSCSTSVIRHPEHSFIACNIDRWVNDGEYILECKTAGFMQRDKWGKMPINLIPKPYWCQVAYYAAITDVPKVDIAVLIGGQDFRIYTYHRNKELESNLIDTACDFWNNHILPRIPPEAVSMEDLNAKFPNGKNKEIVANEIVAGKIDELKIISGAEKELELEKNDIIFDVKSYIQDNDILTDSHGNCLATWKNAAPRVIFDLKRFKEERYDIYRNYIKESKSTRRFLIK